MRKFMKRLAYFTLILASLSSLASEKSLYNFKWLDQDKEVYVLQNRKFRKSGKVSVSAGFGQTTGRSYVEGTAMQARASYFLKEDWGLEFMYSANDGDENDLAVKVRDQGAVPYFRIIDSYKGVNLVWSPFYSKINIFNKILYYDWMFSLGYMSIENSDNRVRFTTSSDATLTSETNNGYQIGTTLLFYLTEHFGLRIDISHIRFEADFHLQGGVTEPFWFRNTDVTVGLNYTF